MLKFILEKDKEGFISWIIQRDMPGKKIYCISKIAEEIFKGWMNFENEFVNSINGSSEILNEFKSFYYKFKETGYSQYVEFDFIHVQLLWN
jgi:hypothetical protein